MYSYSWDEETGGIILDNNPLLLSKEPRPVYYRELDLLGFDTFWKYEKNDAYPYMWAESNNYFYRGKKVASVHGGACFRRPKIELIDEPEKNGAPLRFVDIAAMVEKNRDIIESLEQNTIKQTYNIYVKYKDKVDVFYVAFSGGKDSVAVLDIVQRALPHNAFMVLFGDTKMEFPDTYDVVNRVKKECESRGIRFLKAASELEPEDTWRKFGPPAQTVRWCCSVHKVVPQILLLRKVLNKPNFSGMAFTGIRRSESFSRSGYDIISRGEKVQEQYSCHAIIEWNSAEVFTYIYARKLILNEAYKKGNSRAGCLVCPLATAKNIYFKEQVYGHNDSGMRSTSDFNKIILETSAKDLSSEEAISEFMNIGGWKARRSGKELSIARTLCVDSFEQGIFKIQLLHKSTEWREWIKTVGEVTYLENGDIDILFQGGSYHVQHKIELDSEIFTVNIGKHTKVDLYFMKALKAVFRKAAYCIQCRFCEANCPNGFIHMDNGAVKIDNRCFKCRKCHDVRYGCLLADSLRLPKQEKKMGSIDRYTNLGIKYDWVKDYFDKKDEFWNSAHGLGSKMVVVLKRFLNDCGITINGTYAPFGKIIDKIGIEETKAWALMLCNLAYTSEFYWWVKNVKVGTTYTAETIALMLPENLTNNTRKHIVSAYKNIFMFNPHFKTIGLGKSDYEEKNERRILKSITRGSWRDPDPLVILYSLYKFAEACDGYYQFTLARLLTHDIESKGISPTEIFNINRDMMERVLLGLSANYEKFINASFTLGLDVVTLNSEKTSSDVLALF